MSALKVSGTKMQNMFGNVDGASEDFQNFIKIPSIKLSFSDLEKTVIIGRKGSGKTFYARQYYDLCKKRDDVIAIPPNFSTLNSIQMVQASHYFKSGEASSAWQTIWQNALLLSFSTHIFSSDRREYVDKYLTSGQKSFLARKKKMFEEIFLKKDRLFGMNFNLTYGVVECALYQLNILSNNQYRSSFLNRDVWIELRIFLASIISKVPIFVYFIDRIDDDFNHAPESYIDCQKGLFYAVKDLRTEPRTKKLHVVATFRETLSSAVGVTVNTIKSGASNAIAPLDWNYPMARELISRKLEQLRAKALAGESNSEDHEDVSVNFVKPSDPHPVRAWLGFTAIENASLSAKHEAPIHEDVIDYIVRHTTTVPREIVFICNNIANRIESNRDFGSGFSQADFRREVDICTSKIAGQLAADFGNLLASSMKGHDYLRDRHDFEGGRDDADQSIFVEKYRRILADIVLEIGVSTFSHRKLQQAVALHQDGLNRDKKSSRYDYHELQHLLWRTGIIGFRQFNEEASSNSEDIFFLSDKQQDSLELPIGKDVYLFHTSICSYFSLENNSDRPIGGQWIDISD
jgi:hypothetical protein